MYCGTQASILVSKGRPAAAQEALETATAHNFSIKAWPAFHVLQGFVLLSQAEVRPIPFGVGVICDSFFF